MGDARRPDPTAASDSSWQHRGLGLAWPGIQKEPEHRGGVSVKHLRTHDTLITDLVDAHLGSVEARTAYGIDRAVPKQDAYRPCAIAPKSRAEYTLPGTLKGRPRAHEAYRVSYSPFPAAPYSAVGQHICLVNLYLVGIAGEDMLQVAVLDRGEQPPNHFHLIGHLNTPCITPSGQRAGRPMQPGSRRPVGIGHSPARQRRSPGGVEPLPAVDRPRRRSCAPPRRGWRVHTVGGRVRSAPHVVGH